MLLVGCAAKPTEVRLDISAQCAAAPTALTVVVTAGARGKSLTRQAPRLPATLIIVLPDAVTMVEGAVSGALADGSSFSIPFAATTMVHATVEVPVALPCAGGGELATTPDDLATSLDFAAAPDLAARVDLASPPRDLTPSAPPSFVNLATASLGSPPNDGTQLTVALPTGTTSGDLLLAGIYAGDDGATALPTLTPPAGWTLARPLLTHTTIATLGLYWRFAGAGEPASYTFTISAKVSGVAQISAYRGVDPARPIDAYSGSDVGACTSCTVPSVTTTVANTRLVAAVGGYNSASTATTWTAPALTVRSSGNNNSARSGLIADKAQAAAGASGSFTATASVAQDDVIVTLMALSPLP